MMMNHAGGPGLVSPLDYGDTPRWKLTPTTLTAVAIVLAAHVGVGYPELVRWMVEDASCPR